MTFFAIREPRAKDEEELARVALEIDRVMRERAPAGWKGDQAREAQVLNALFPLLSRDRDASGVCVRRSRRRHVCPVARKYSAGLC